MRAGKIQSLLFIILCITAIISCKKEEDDVSVPVTNSCGVTKNEITLLGLHGTMDAEAIIDLNVDIVRFGFADYKLKETFDDDGGAAFLATLSQLHNEGIKIITFLTWPENEVEGPGVKYDRIPVGTDRTEALELLDGYLEEAGPYIDWIQINQEPFGVTPYHEEDAEPDSAGLVPALEWWKVVANHIDQARKSNASISHLKILTPGLTGIKSFVNNNVPDPDFDEQFVTEELIDSFISFGEQYCDAIDVHLHTESVELGIAEIEYITQRTNKPLGCTEWSQAHAAKATGWLDIVNPNYGMTNRNVISAAYQAPMSPASWQSFMKDAPYTPCFIADFYSAMSARGLLFACYGGLYQYGNPAFDWKMLVAQKTTTPIANNQPFYNEFTSLN